MSRQVNHSTQRKNLIKRFEQALGPIGAGFILDVVDFMTFGPLGIVLGLFAGSAVGWYLTGVLGMPKKWRVIVTWLAAIYCFMPGTEFIPVGTLVGALCRFFQPPPGGAKKEEDTETKPDKR